MPDSSLRFRVEPLASQHDRSQFACGVAALDRYIRMQAGQDARRNYASVFVALEPKNDVVVAYYTLSMAAVALGLLPPETQRKMPRYPMVPAVRLGRLAVAIGARGVGVGRLLLLDAMFRIVRNDIAWSALVVDAKDETARAFYEYYGFLRFAEDPFHLYLPRGTVEEALRG